MCICIYTVTASLCVVGLLPAKLYMNTGFAPT